MSLLKRISVFAIAFVLTLAASAQAAGKKPQPDPTGTPIYKTPLPIRKTILQSVKTIPFQLPNGSTVNLGADLNTLLSTAVASTNAFAPTDPPANGQSDPCNSHLEIRAAVSTFEMNVASVGVSFGYTPSGASNTVTNLNGNATVNIGTIAMDFGVWECVNGQCSETAAVTASQDTAGVNASMQIDFSQVTTSPSFIYNTPLGGAIQAIMKDGMTRLAASPKLSLLPWEATVREYLPESGMLIFDAGEQTGLQPNEAFEIYAVTPATGICNVFQTVAYVHTTQVDAISSQAVVDQAMNSTPIQDGDLVMIHAVSSTGAP